MDDDGEEKELMERLKQLSVPASDEEGEGKFLEGRQEVRAFNLKEFKVSLVYKASSGQPGLFQRETVSQKERKEEKERGKGT